MKNKRIVSLAIITLILAALVYLQFRSWQSFDWAKFGMYTTHISLWHIGAGVALIYLAYVLRAVRWAIFLQPTRPTKFRSLIAPQMIGFAALGLFGRAGEFARPYLIGRKLNLSFSSQLAVWTVERFFDLGAVVVMIGGLLSLGRRGTAQTRLLAALHNGLASAATRASHKAPLMLAMLVILALIIFALTRLQGKFGANVREKLLAFKDGLNTIHSAQSFVALVVVSLCMWLMIAGAYIEVLHSYPPTTVIGSDGSGHVAMLGAMRLNDVMLVMASSMLGSVVQLPGGVGGSQLAVIGVLQYLFGGEPYNITKELAVSCGILLWLVTFMSVIPAGLLLAKFEKIRFLSLSGESESSSAPAATPHASCAN